MYDVIIVGGGVGGLFLASKLEGLDVLVLERNKKITLRDSGIVSNQFKQLFKTGSIIKDKITGMELLSKSQSINIHTRKPFAYILKREEFTSHLRKLASKKAAISYEAVTGIDHTDNGVIVKTNSGEYGCKVIVGSDGYNSVARQSARIAAPKFAMGIMAITNSSTGNGIKVFFNKHYSPDFFSWIIPQNKEYGIISGTRPKEYLDFFKKKENLGNGKLYSYPIPVGFTKSFHDNTILIGDSCGQVKPLTGGGIMFSLRAAQHASRTITEAFEKNRFDAAVLKKYQIAWKKDFALEIRKQLIFRNLYRRFSNAQIDSMFKDFKNSLEKLDYFDYDNFSTAWIKMPKIQLLKTAMSQSKSLLHSKIT